MKNGTKFLMFFGIFLLIYSLVFDALKFQIERLSPWSLNINILLLIAVILLAVLIICLVFAFRNDKLKKDNQVKLWIIFIALLFPWFMYCCEILVKRIWG